MLSNNWFRPGMRMCSRHSARTRSRSMYSAVASAGGAAPVPCVQLLDQTRRTAHGHRGVAERRASGGELAPLDAPPVREDTIRRVFERLP